MEQYCDENCHRKALKYYELQEKYAKLFSFVNIVCIFGIPIGLFIFSFASDVGGTIFSFSLIFEGLIIILFPFPVENMITSMKIKKAMNVTRIIGLILLILGITAFIANILFFAK